MTIPPGMLRKFPSMYLTVELTNRCNLRCPLCSTGSGFDKKPKGMMKFEDFAAFLDKCAPLLHTIGFFGSGEPLLHPEFIRFVEYAAKEKSKSTFCLSNGMYIQNPEAIVKSGLREMHLDIDGITQQQHRLYRVGADLDTVKENVKKLVRARKKLRSRFPEIYMDTLISRYNEQDYQELIQLAKNLGADGIRLKTVNDDLGLDDTWLPTREKFKQVKRKDNSFRCFFKDTLAGTLAWDGEMQLCCMTPNHKKPRVKLNAFREEHLLERLDSQEFLKITKKAGHYPFCKNCSLKVYESYQEAINF